ncbi:MAG TPA: TPM domain-containing protein [Candidatus Paenibacillus intestinavium]|nr:TPM domain-containing protein [Candidatus Paenibacillus intestinavium]
MKKHHTIFILLFFIVMMLVGPVNTVMAESAESKILIFDEAELLSQEEYDTLNKLANELGGERATDIIILTTANSDNIDVVKMTENFYDDYGPGYDKPHGNAVILTMDMRNRDIYLAGFYKAEQYLDNKRLDKIRNKITPYLSDGAYADGFEKYIATVHRYMSFKPGVNPDNILFNIWFQLGAAAVIGAIVVSIMAYNSGGRVTVNRTTYEDAGTSGILDRKDQYIRTTVIKTKIEKNNSSGGGGGGGGGFTGGGHSHSGSRGKF